jgi:hypothetical protein
MTDIAIRVQNLSKMYRIGAKEQARRNLRQTARSLATAPFDYLRRMRRPPTEEETLWALRDVSLRCSRARCWASSAATARGRAPCSKSSRASRSQRAAGLFALKVNLRYPRCSRKGGWDSHRAGFGLTEEYWL